MIEINKNPNLNNELFGLTNSKELIEMNKKLVEKIENLEKSNKEILEKINNIQVKNITTTNFGEINKNIGNRVQKINPESGLLIKYYESISEVIGEDSTIKRSSLVKAINSNTIYRNYRWVEVSRELDPKQIHNYKPTNNITTSAIGYIAKLNKEKNQILNVYLDRKVASLSNGFKSHSALDNPVKNKKEIGGHYYILYHECEKKLIENFEKKLGSQVLLYASNGIGQYDKSNKLVKEFSSKQDCVKFNGIGDRTLKKALDSNVPYKEFTYKYIEPKPKCF